MKPGGPVSMAVMSTTERQLSNQFLEFRKERMKAEEQLWAKLNELSAYFQKTSSNINADHDLLTKLDMPKAIPDREPLNAISDRESSTYVARLSQRVDALETQVSTLSQTVVRFAGSSQAVSAVTKQLPAISSSPDIIKPILQEIQDALSQQAAKMNTIEQELRDQWEYVEDTKQKLSGHCIKISKITLKSMDLPPSERKVAIDKLTEKHDKLMQSLQPGIPAACLDEQASANPVPAGNTASMTSQQAARVDNSRATGIGSGRVAMV